MYFCFFFIPFTGNKGHSLNQETLKYMNKVVHILLAIQLKNTHKKTLMHQYFVKSYQELSVQLHSSVSLFVFLQTMIGCWVRSDDCNRRGKSRWNAVQPLCLSYSLIPLTLSLCCMRQHKQTGHSCSIQHWLSKKRLSNVVNLKNKITDIKNKSTGRQDGFPMRWTNQHSWFMASLVHLCFWFR